MTRGDIGSSALRIMQLRAEKTIAALNGSKKDREPSNKFSSSQIDQ